jgi:hypothetical protein
MIAAIPVAVGLNQVYLAYFRPLLTHRLDGMWCVADVVRQSHNPDFVGMEVKFILHLEQDSDGHLSGNGRKALGNGALPPPVEISSLAVQKGSSVSGSDVRISFVEGNDARPERRNLVGTFVWSIVDKDTLVGNGRRKGLKITAPVAKLVDATDLKSVISQGCTGSSPVGSTTS